MALARLEQHISRELTRAPVFAPIYGFCVVRDAAAYERKEVHKAKQTVGGGGLVGNEHGAAAARFLCVI